MDRPPRPGERVVARVVDVRDNGIFLEYEGWPGIVNVTELTWLETDRSGPAAFAKVGESLEVVVMASGEESFGASIRELDPAANPWTFEDLRSGARHAGSVRAVRDFAVFVGLDVGLVAALDPQSHATELSVGERCEVRLTVVDRQERRLRAELL